MSFGAVVVVVNALPVNDVKVTCTSVVVFWYNHVPDDVRNSSKSALNLKQNSRNTTVQSMQSKGGNGEVSVSTEGRVTSPENLAGAAEKCSDGIMTCNNNRGDTEDIEEEVGLFVAVIFV